MSVLINMKMPECCAECDVEGHYENSNGDEYGFFCPFGYKAYTSETRELKRLDDCHLIPVTPHGRLIDADALEASCFMGSSSFYTQSDIDYAPTIIPADEQKEE